MNGLELAAIGNCAIASLITRTGRHVWFCFPRLDSEPLFSALVAGKDPENGFHDVILADGSHWSQQYVPNTAILQTTGSDSRGGSIRITDFAPRHERFGRSFHPKQLVRIIEPLSGRPRIRIRMRPHFGYGRTAPSISSGSNHVRFTDGEIALRVTTDMSVAYLIEERDFVLDRPIHLFMGADEPVPEDPQSLAASFLMATKSYWQDWVRGLSIPFEWQEAVIRSAITLKLCSFEDTGAIVAALTTSIPEAPGSTRNWDYRYCWIRDAYFTVGALNRLGATRTMENFIRFVLDAILAGENRHRIAPVYRICGDKQMPELDAPSLPGFQGMGPVRFGNGAALQVQNDVYGSIVLTSAQMFWDERLPMRGNRALYGQLKSVGLSAVDFAFFPDAGPWEYRGRLAPHTYSAAMCWAAAQRLSMIADLLEIADDAEMWRKHASRIRDEILKRATTRDGWISGVLDHPVVDASSLLLLEIGLLDPRDPRMTKTIDVVAQHLMKDGLIFRYSDADDFGIPKTAFLVCTFWYCDALSLAGRRQEARELFQHVLKCRNQVGLLSEDFDSSTHTLWGNFPQAYSHVGLINSASKLSRTWEEALWRTT